MSGLPYSAALVTGASQRIGRAIALSLAEQGLAIAIHHRNSAEEAEQVAKHIRDAGGKAVTLQGDLASAKTIEILVEEASQKLEMPVDVLVNNASVFQKDTLQSLDTASWDLHQQVNLRAPILLTQSMATQLPEGKRGCVINLIDQRVLKLNPQYFSYTASKAGLWTTTRTMAQSLAPTIRVNAISPGPTLGNQFQSEEDFQAENTNVMLGSGPSVDEICETVKFLLETPSVTGQMMTLDGGQHLAWRTPDILED